MDEKTLVTIEIALRILTVLAGNIAQAVSNGHQDVDISALYITRTAEDALAETQKKK